jgi:hypothetical protein
LCARDRDEGSGVAVGGVIHLNQIQVSVVGGGAALVLLDHDQPTCLCTVHGQYSAHVPVLLSAGTLVVVQPLCRACHCKTCVSCAVQCVIPLAVALVATSKQGS